MKTKCIICNKELPPQSIGGHVKHTHSIEYQDYLHKYYAEYPELFPTWKYCDVCGKLTRVHGKAFVACSQECAGKMRSQNYKGRKAWNKGLTKENNEIVAHQSQTIIEKRKMGWCPRTGTYHTEESKLKMSNTRKERGLGAGATNGMFGKTHTPEAIKKIFAHRKMNKLEKKVADILDANNIKYHFQFFITENEICKSYDFKIKGKPIILEIDGDFWHGNPKTKYHWKDAESVHENDILKTKLAESQGYKLLRFWQSDIKKDPAILMEKLEVEFT